MANNKDEAFVCGTCINNDNGLCDCLGIFVEDDDEPQCPYGKDWSSKLEGRT